MTMDIGDKSSAMTEVPWDTTTEVDEIARSEAKQYKYPGRDSVCVSTTLFAVTSESAREVIFCTGKSILRWIPKLRIEYPARIEEYLLAQGFIRYLAGVAGAMLHSFCLQLTHKLT